MLLYVFKGLFLWVCGGSVVAVTKCGDAFHQLFGSVLVFHVIS
jgi:hypothetical protein